MPTLTDMPSPVFEATTMMFLDRRLLYITTSGFEEELYAAPLPNGDQNLSVVAHGAVVIANYEAETPVQVAQYEERPADATSDVSFALLEGEVVVNNPLWAGPPGEIAWSPAPGRWCLDARQTDRGGRIRLRFWPEGA